MSFSVWEHNLKDIQLPFEVEGFRIISSILINQNDSIIIKKDNKMIVNIEGGFENIKKGTTLGIIKCGAENISLNYRENIWDLFSDFNNIEYDKSKVFHTWDHKPLVSSSIKYIGSYYKHKASIFEIELPYTLNEIVVVKNLSEEVKIRVWQ